MIAEPRVRVPRRVKQITDDQALRIEAAFLAGAGWREIWASSSFGFVTLNGLKHEFYRWVEEHGSKIARLPVAS